MATNQAKDNSKKFGGKGIYIMLCAGVLAVTAITAAAYKSAVTSLTEGLAKDDEKIYLDDIDFSEVDAILSDIEKEQQEATTQSSLEDITPELETVFYEQAVYMPINGEIINEFSDGELVKSSNDIWRTHDGIDIKAELGTEVKSMTKGTVTDIYQDSLWGNCIVIDHQDGITGYYFGLDPQISVSKGDEVMAGEAIGLVGNTADIESDMEPHLHFGLKYGNEWIDPISYIEPYK